MILLINCINKVNINIYIYITKNKSKILEYLII